MRHTGGNDISGDNNSDADTACRWPSANSRNTICLAGRELIRRCRYLLCGGIYSGIGIVGRLNGVVCYIVQKAYDLRLGCASALAWRRNLAKNKPSRYVHLN